MRLITNNGTFCMCLFFILRINYYFKLTIFIGDKMNKVFIGIVIIIIGYVLFNSVNSKAYELVIPENAIRMRVIPNSNSDYDQQIKAKVKEVLQTTTYDLLKDTKGSEEAEKIIKANLSLIDNRINDLLVKENYNLDYKINFGLNYFPDKEFKGVTYTEGYYNSLLVTLGAGEGDNWWCVLFPPMCLIEAEESEEVEYKFFIQELLEKYL